PYSAALIRLVPKMDQRVHHRLRPIPGQPPISIGALEGCRFAPRCEYRQDRCAVEPPIIELGPQHSAACWRAEELVDVMHAAHDHADHAEAVANHG
ncbi:MAG TPA: hypothetical protein PLV68_01325, partial [Ilumatobacteraceae bacterium]|nr:hypothetical protein [Ilumatobacteraceae bacterium]